MTDRPAIKPLEWETHPGDGSISFQGSTNRQYVFRALHPFGAYFILTDDKGAWVEKAGVFGEDDGYPDIDAAKAAAQSDFASRIRSCLLAPTCESGDGVKIKEIQMEDWSNGYAEEADPIYRIEANGYCADFATKTAAENFLGAIRSCLLDKPEAVEATPPQLRVEGTPTRAEEIIKTVRAMIAAEQKHLRMLETDPNPDDPTTTSRDDADLHLAHLTGFTLADCDAALRLVRRRTLSPQSRTTPAATDAAQEDIK